jgi:hypothetical protein
MAVTENLYTGNGSTVLYSFTFPYLETTDIKVSVNGTNTNAYTLANATTVQFNTAPASSAAIRIYRQTDDTALPATFYPGSAIRSSDLNENFTQNLYVTQESNNSSTSAATAAAAATTTANTALSNSTAAQSSAATAISTANAASAAAASAVSTANTANSNAAAAVSTANTANTNATAALNAAAEALAYTVVANVAAIPGSPVNGDAIRILDSTGIQSFTPLSGLPVGFIGDSGLTVEIYYSSSSSTWVWVRYYATDADARYLKLTGGTLTGQLKADDSTSTALPVYSFDGDVNTGLAHPGADELALVTGGTARLTVDPSGAVNVPVSLSVGANAVLDAGDIGVSVQAYNANILTSSAIGSTVQAYDADTAKTDVVQTFTVAQRGAVSALTSAATVTPDFAVANNFSLTLGHSLTLANPTNLTAGQSGAIVITQGSGTAYTVAYGSYWKFSGGTPTMSTALSSVSTLVYYVESSTRITTRLITEVT